MNIIEYVITFRDVTTTEIKTYSVPADLTDLDKQGIKHEIQINDNHITIIWLTKDKTIININGIKLNHGSLLKPFERAFITIVARNCSIYPNELIDQMIDQFLLQIKNKGEECKRCMYKTYCAEKVATFGMKLLKECTFEFTNSDSNYCNETKDKKTWSK